MNVKFDMVEGKLDGHITHSNTHRDEEIQRLAVIETQLDDLKP
jgi:hypothetical protein